MFLSLFIYFFGNPFSQKYEGFEKYPPVVTRVCFMAIIQPLMRPNKRLADPRTPQKPITKHFNDRYDRGKLIFSKQT